MSGCVLDPMPNIGTIFNFSVYYVAAEIIKQTNRNPETVVRSLLRRQPKPFIGTKEDLYDLLDHYEEDEQQQAELRRNNPNYWTD